MRKDTDELEPVFLARQVIAGANARVEQRSEGMLHPNDVYVRKGELGETPRGQVFPPIPG